MSVTHNSSTGLQRKADSNVRGNLKIGGTTVINSSRSIENVVNGTFSGDVTVQGTLTAQEFKTELVSASILFESGSTIFGNSNDDTHSFTGCLVLSGTPALGSENTALMVNDSGVVGTRDLGTLAFSSATYDNYNNWKISVEGGTADSILSGQTVNFVEGNNITLGYDASTNTITITANDTDTTYSAGTGLNLSGTSFSLSHLGIQSLTDPNADRILFWDDSASATAWLALGTNLSISDTTLNATDTNTTYTAGTGLKLTGTEFRTCLNEIGTGTVAKIVGVDSNGNDVTNVTANVTVGNANCVGGTPAACVVYVCGNQTIAGNKTFSNEVYVSGKIGAGTSTPGCTLSVDGSACISGELRAKTIELRTTSAGNVLRWVESDSTTQAGSFRAYSNRGEINLYNNGTLCTVLSPTKSTFGGNIIFAGGNRCIGYDPSTYGDCTLVIQGSNNIGSNPGDIIIKGGVDVDTNYPGGDINICTGTGVSNGVVNIVTGANCLMVFGQVGDVAGYNVFSVNGKTQAGSGANQGAGFFGGGSTGDNTADLYYVGENHRFRANRSSSDYLSILAAGEVVVNDASIDLNFRVESNSYTNMLFVDGGTNRIGINTATPGSMLHLKQYNSTSANGITLEAYNSGLSWNIWQDNNNDLQLRSSFCSPAAGGYLASSAYVTNIDFTGQHRSTEGQGFTTGSYQDLVGLIVVADGTYNNLDGSSTANINESLPNVILSCQTNDKRVFGVISDKEDLSDGRKYATGTFVSVFPTESSEAERLIINSVGEGGMWVSNYNGNLENGDYITSSPILGLGMKQDDDLLHNYTVAKITQDCDFTEDYEEIEHNGQVYRRVFVGVTYHSG